MCPQDFLNRRTWPSSFGLSVDVLCSLPCRPSLTEQAERGDCAPAFPHTSPGPHFLPALLPHLHDTAEFPTPPPTPPERQTPEALPTPPASPCLPAPPSPPPPAPASPPAPSTHQSEDPCPASAPCHPPPRYEHELC